MSRSFLPRRDGEAPLVSIVMPCFNNEAYVAEAIDSALGQTYDNIEVIVIDDGSTDGSLDIIRSYGDRITWRTGPNEGACAARNKGLALARGEFIKFLDADDILLPECMPCRSSRAAGCPVR
jgi:glycosyltransferase involved in cell wall biosynthesis